MPKCAPWLLAIRACDLLSHVWDTKIPLNVTCRAPELLVKHNTTRSSEEMARAVLFATGPWLLRDAFRAVTGEAGRLAGGYAGAHTVNGTRYMIYELGQWCAPHACSVKLSCRCSLGERRVWLALWCPCPSLGKAQWHCLGADAGSKDAHVMLAYPPL